MSVLLFCTFMVCYGSIFTLSTEWFVINLPLSIYPYQFTLINLPVSIYPYQFTRINLSLSIYPVSIYPVSITQIV